ncbi:hypothetical protein DDZ14_15050 [Maritimibacter sp. 55A14]|uniref:hypothetical protein n=1 Tax=Maritimibacter sp. 55A14 TaxID=2174844 RepID=UPI000D6119FF|nr:hypothetical protein [Maritimibacter sp. 55A14]PWE30598.1 hypothetical protein DDZ14_15050 [Maritimibacter sp. 55A14]
MNIMVDHSERPETVSKDALAPLISSIENPALREYCSEQLAASETQSEIDATLRLVFELVPMPAQPVLC